MAKRIQMWKELGPQIESGSPMDPEEVIEELIGTTNQTKGSLLGLLAELDRVTVKALRFGRRVKLPNGLRFRPVGKRDGSIVIKIEYGVRIKENVNTNPHVKWKNAKNIGLSDEEMVALWNELYPDDPIED